MDYRTELSSPLGRLTLASNGEELTGLWLAGQKYFGASLSENAVAKPGLPVFLHTKDWLDRYFRQERPRISELPLAPAGSEFRQSVWQILCRIPFGQILTYGAIANMLGAGRMSAQAVGGAVGHNPISIIIPCHRVVGTNGSLTGYAGGLKKKLWLLQHEGVDISGFRLP